MRIGVMLRHYDQHGGGVRTYTRELLAAMFALNGPHEFVLLYRNPDLVGTYANARGVTERHIAGRTVISWDQLSVPNAVRKLGIDVLFNPKYSMSLGVNCPTAWVCHGLDWYVMPEASRFIDRLSHRWLVPRYAAKADAIIAVSEITREHVMHFLHVAPHRVHTVYSGVNTSFSTPLAPANLNTVRERYRLPDRFVLYAGAVYPPKNFTRLIQAYARSGPPRGVPLVIAGGENRFLSENELKEPERLGLGDWVRWAGWVPSEDMPAFYRLADALLLPSLFESCGLPVLEAMAADCPVVTSDCYGTKELAEGAAVLVNPESVENIAEGIGRVLDDSKLRVRLTSAGRERVARFTWRRCAAETLEVLERVARRA
ncbi:MAG TPA: glycosyltransferase family 1 protein [Steroidobacteraceae bacterium]